MADSAKSDCWQPYAASAAASVTLHLIKKLKWTKDKSAPDIAVENLFIGVRHQTMELIVSNSIADSCTTDQVYREIPIEMDVKPDGSGVREAVIAHRVISGTLSNVTSSNPIRFGYYGIAHIPLVIDLAAHFGIKSQIDLFEHNRNTDEWPMLENHGHKISCKIKKQSMGKVKNMAIAVSASYPVNDDQIESSVGRMPIWHLGLDKVQLDPIADRCQIETVADEFRKLIDEAAQIAERIHFFYAGPVSLAFALGRRISKNIHPEIWSYNFSRSQEPNYKWAVCITRDLEVAPVKILGGLDVQP